MIRILLAVTVLATTFNICAGPIKSLTEYRRLRKDMLNKPRAVIYNNDGGDAYLYPKSKLPFSIDKFLGLRTSPLKGSDVKTISYCTISSSFGQFTHATRVGEFLVNTHNRKGRENVTPEFVKLKTDPLKEVIKFGHANGMEVFWSNRMNDTHDYGHRPDKPYERWSKLKQAHPEYLMGKCGEHLPNGRWSAVDFTHPQIRALAVKYLTEVCENYDVDGIELDFFRHLFLFKSVAKGGKASVKELRMLTDMLRKIRAMTEREGMKRGRPVLVAIRVPDSVEYCRDLGIDLNTWLRDGLIDILIGSGYFRLNDWRYIVKLGHEYNVKVYAGLSEPRVRNGHSLLPRHSKMTYRARAAEAIQAGVDGIYLFNQFSVASPKMGYIREIGNSKKLSKLNKLYFITYRNGRPNRDLKNGIQHQRIKVLAPGKARCLRSVTCRYSIYIGDERHAKSSTLILYGRSLIPADLSVKLNGISLKFIRAGKGLLYYDVPLNILKLGENIFAVNSSSMNGSSACESILKGDERLVWKTQGLWRRLFSGKPRVEKVVDKSYLLGDLGAGTNVYNLIYPWNASDEGRNSVTFKAKLKSTTSPDAVCVRVANGKYAEYLRFEPDRISLKYAGGFFKLDTRSKFHTYKIELNKSRIMVYVNGKLRLRQKLRTLYKKDAAVFALASFRTSYMASNSIVIGSLSGPGKGEAYWKDIKLASFNPTLMDVALLVVTDPQEPDVLPFAQRIQRTLLQKFPQLNTMCGTLLAEWKTANGLPSSPWKGRYYDSDNAKIEKGNLVLDHNGSGKKEYCYYEYRISNKHKLSRFLGLTFEMRLLGKKAEPQFTIITALPDDSGNATIWSFKFGRKGIWGRNGRRDMFVKYPLDSNYHDFRVIFDRKAGIAQMYIKGQKNPVITACGRKANKYPACVRFGDASGQVKGKVELKNFTIKQLDK